MAGRKKVLLIRIELIIMSIIKKTVQAHSSLHLLSCLKDHSITLVVSDCLPFWQHLIGQTNKLS